MSTISRLDPIVHLAATRTFIGWLCSDPNNVKLFEEVGDTTIDYATLTLSHPSITCVMDKEDPNVFNHLAYTAGRWNFIMKLDEYPSWKNRFMNSFGPDDVEFTIHVNLDGLWLAKKQLNYNTTRIQLHWISSSLRISWSKFLNYSGLALPILCVDMKLT